MLNENLIKGQIIELKVQEELLRYGFDISIPSYNVSRYDLIADTGEELLRIQVKKSISNSNSSFTFECTSQNSRSKTQKGRRKYTNEEIDYFATVWKDNVRRNGNKCKHFRWNHLVEVQVLWGAYF